MNSPPHCRQANLSRTISQTVESGTRAPRRMYPQGLPDGRGRFTFGAAHGSPENVAGTKDEKPQSLGSADRPEFPFRRPALPTERASSELQRTRPHPRTGLQLPAASPHENQAPAFCMAHSCPQPPAACHCDHSPRDAIYRLSLHQTPGQRKCLSSNPDRPPQPHRPGYLWKARNLANLFLLSRSFWLRCLWFS
jgi:hypothetical protein